VVPLFRRLATWLVLAATLAIGARADAAPPSPLRIDFIDVGQGDAALVRSSTGKTVLIDGGPKVSGPAVIELLRERHVAALDLVILTHRHADHLGGLAQVIRAVKVQTFLDAELPYPSSAYDRLVKTLRARHVPVRQAQRGRTIDIGGGATITLLGPPDPPINHSRSDVNANSVVARVDYQKVGVLFAADAEPETERWLLTSGAQLPAQILKVAHHGGRYSSTEPFLRVVQPLAAVISVGAINNHKHPTPETLARLDALPAHVYRTDQDGTVTVETDGTRIEVTTARGKREILSAR